jgi:hypothetical protein
MIRKPFTPKSPLEIAELLHIETMPSGRQHREDGGRKQYAHFTLGRGALGAAGLMKEGIPGSIISEKGYGPTLQAEAVNIVTVVNVPLIRDGSNLMTRLLSEGSPMPVLDNEEFPEGNVDLASYWHKLTAEAVFEILNPPVQQ